MALLHGHSYSAHAVGCASAAKAIQWFKDPSTNPNIDSEQKILKEVWLIFCQYYFHVVHTMDILSFKEQAT